MIVNIRNRWAQVVIPGLLISMSLNAQQPIPMASSTESSAKLDVSTNDQIAALKEQLAAQQKQLEQLRSAMQKQQDAIEKATLQIENAQAHQVNTEASLGEVASTTGMVPMPAIVTPSINPTIPLSTQTQQQPGKGESPLGFHIGGATFTPLGFVDFISVTRSTNTGNNLGTTFGGIPYSNTAAGGLSETRFSMQNSRIGLRVDSNVGDYKVLGYLESDFLGNAPTNIYVTSNSDTLRLRLYFVDIVKNAFEFEAGQTWTLLTPGRNKIGVLPADIFYTQDIDTNYQAGLPWARQTGARFTWNPSDNFHWAIALENPQQYVGGGVVLPTKLTGLTNEVDNGSNSAGVPNLFPDIISKIAFDGGRPGHSAHLEVAGFLRSFKTFNSATTGAGADTRFTKVGGGGAVNFNFELAKGFRILSANFFSDGGGRYIGNTGAPDFVLRSDGSLSLVHTASTVDGVEFQATPKTLFYAYYGGTYIGKNGGIDQDGKTPIGYGFSGSPGSNNRTVQEATFGLQNNFWKSPQYGALMLAFQYSYLTRSPWSVTTAGAPTNALTNIGFVNLRYTLP